MIVSYQTSENDFVRAGAFMLRRKTGIPNRWATWGALTFLSAFGISTLFIPSSVIFSLLPFALLLSFFYFGIPIASRRSFTQLYRKNPLYAEARTLQADFTGTHMRSESSSSDAAWTNYEAYAEDRHSFLLIHRGNQIFFPIPKRDLSPAQIEEVRCTFETYLPRR